MEEATYTWHARGPTERQQSALMLMLVRRVSVVSYPIFAVVYHDGLETSLSLK